MILRRAWRLKRGTKDADLNLVQVSGICTKIGVKADFAKRKAEI
jgi:hypothetical protein